MSESAEIKERLAKLEGIISEMSKRLNHIEAEIAEIRKEVAAHFRWTVGLILGMWITVMMTLIPILLKILGVI